MNFTEVALKNPGVLKFTLPPDLLNDLQTNISTLESFSENQKKMFQANSVLVGQIAHEYFLKCPENLKKFVLDSVRLYTDYYDFKRNANFVLDKFWVNFQSKYEYNPIHNHVSDFSFVIWTKIPYDINEEDLLTNTKKAQSKLNGRFQLLYETHFNGINTMTVDLDKTFEGIMLLFPSTAHHAVYPYYTTDEIRVSVAGNIKII